MTALSDPALSSWSFVFQLLTIGCIVLSFIGAIGLWLTTHEIIARKDLKVENQHNRVILREQQDAFVSSLANAPKGKAIVCIFNQDAEIETYANQVRDMVTAAGYDSEDRVEPDIGSKSSPVGIFILIKDASAQPPFAGPLQRAFKKIGIDAQGDVDPSVPDGVVKIVVGRKSSN